MRTVVKLSPVVVLGILLMITMGCEGVLEVDNPNALLEEDIEHPVGARALVNGTVHTVSQGIGYIYSVYSIVSDETYWDGSRDAFNILDRGNIDDFRNEFSDDAWPYMAEGRWMSDRAVELLEGFHSAGSLADSRMLARALLYNALIYTVIGETYNDFVFSDKQNVQPPIGESNMLQLFDTAISRLNQALNHTAGDATLQKQIRGLLARAMYSRAVWNQLNPKGTVPSNPYLSSADIRAAAEAALAVMDSDFVWQLDYRTSLIPNLMAWWLVGREENYFTEPPNDPISGQPDPRIVSVQNNFRDSGTWGDQYSPITVTSAREMHTIIAETYLDSNPDMALQHLNTVRSAYGLPDVTADDLPGIIAHERNANLYIQGRRLADMYRFGITSPRWEGTSVANTTPGSFFPIADRERRANPHIN